MKSFLKEFRDFISDGNIVDMSIAFIMGGALQALMQALVNDIFMPLIGIFTGSVSFNDWVLPIGPAQLQIGRFIGTAITFILTGFIVFLIVKAMNKARHLTHTNEPENDETPETELDVLKAIQAELSKQNQA